MEGASAKREFFYGNGKNLTTGLTDGHGNSVIYTFMD
jgi:hypothetical protein